MDLIVVAIQIQICNVRKYDSTWDGFLITRLNKMLVKLLNLKHYFTNITNMYKLKRNLK